MQNSGPRPPLSHSLLAPALHQPSSNNSAPNNNNNNNNNASNTTAADQKRLARCGVCAGCTAKDCGACANCLDKPKFNGPGVKKQACVRRRCLQIVARARDEGDHVPRKKYKASAAHVLMPLGGDALIFDFDAPLGEPSLAPSAAGVLRRQPVRLQRCGKCVACKATDCGTCTNCADKPRFGGKGVKKQACIARRCTNLTKVEDSSESELDLAGLAEATAPGGFAAAARTPSPIDDLNAIKAAIAGNGSPISVMDVDLLSLSAAHSQTGVVPESMLLASQQPTAETLPAWPEALDELGCFAAAETECLPVLSASQVSGSKHDDSLAHVYDYQSVVKIDEWINDVPISAFA